GPQAAFAFGMALVAILAVGDVTTLHRFARGVEPGHRRRASLGRATSGDHDSDHDGDQRGAHAGASDMDDSMTTGVHLASREIRHNTPVPFCGCAPFSSCSMTPKSTT